MKKLFTAIRKSDLEEVKRIIDNKINIFDFPEIPYVLGVFWPLALPISLVAGIGFGVYCLSEYLVKFIEEKLNI